MNYQVWEPYYPGSGFAFAEAQLGLDDEQENQVFLGGERLADPLPEVTITSLSAGKLPDALGSVWSATSVVTTLHDILREFAAGAIQFIPVRLLRYPNRPYHMVKILAHVACFDRERSDYEAFSDPPFAIHTVWKMVLTSLPNDAPALFRLAELPSAILVRDDLRGKMLSTSSSPGRFIRIEDYIFGVFEGA